MKLISIFLIVITVGSVGSSAWMAMPKNSILMGLAYVDAPLAGATLTIYDMSGNKLYQAKNATMSSGGFIENVAWAWLWGVPSEFKVKITEGTLSGEPFNGTIVRYIQNYDQKTNYPINPLTTLIAAYKDKNSSISYSRAEQNVQNFLEIPSTVGISTVINNADHSRVFFDSSTFINQANANGGLNTYVDTLAVQVGQGQTHPFKGESPVGGLGGDLFCFVGSGLANGAMSWAGGQVMGWAMGMLGFESGDDKILDKLNEMSHKLDEMDQKLDMISSGLQQISDQITELRNALNSMDTDLKRRIGEIGAYDPISKIDASYAILDSYAKGKPGDISNQTINEWTTDVLSSTTGIPFAIDNLNKFIMGHVVGNEEGLLETMTNAMIDQLYQPGATGIVNRYGREYRTTALNLYIGFQDYFEKFLYIEIKGLTLLCEGHHARNETVPVKNYIHDTWQPMIQKQMNLFIAQVERFVINCEIQGELEFPNMGPIPSNQQEALNLYWQVIYGHDLPRVAEIFPLADHFADVKLNGTGRFTARVLVLPVATTTETPPADPKPVFKNVADGTLITPVGIRKTVYLADSTAKNLVFYYFTYDLGKRPTGQYRLTTPTVLSGNPTYTGWFNSTFNEHGEWWSFHDGIKMSLGEIWAGASWMVVSNDENGNPYGYWGGIWWDDSL